MKVLAATTLIHINQYNTDEQNLEKKIGDVNKKYQALVVHWLWLLLIQKLMKLITKYFDLNTKLAALAIKAELKAEQNKIVKLEAFDSTFFWWC